MLKGQLVTIRPFEKQDLTRYRDSVFKQKDLVFDFMMDPKTFEEFSKRFSETGCIESENQVFAVETHEGKFVGTAHVFKTHQYLHLWEVGAFIYEKADRRLGYGFDTAALLISYLFHSRPAQRIMFCTSVENQGMIIGLIALGCEKLGVLRKARFIHGHYHDYQLLTVTFEQAKKQSNQPHLEKYLHTLDAGYDGTEATEKEKI